MAGNTVKEMTINFRKLDKFEGHDFRRWQKKIHLLLTMLNVGYILNGMSYSLSDVYMNFESAKEMWDSLESKILGQYTQHGLKMDESISISSIIDKLPPSWKDFKHTLKHGKYDLSLVQLGSHLRIVESLREQDNDKGKSKEVGGPSVNMTKEGKNKHNKQNKERGLRTNPKTKVDAIAWWIDSGAITHVCKDRCWFKTFKPVEDGSVLYMGDEHFAPVYGKGSVALEFSSGKTITLFNVLCVPKLRKNLVSGPVLSKCGYKKVYESDKYILSKCGVFVGFGYYNNGMFMLNLKKVPDDMSSSSTVVNTTLWHARLGHVHYQKMLEMSKDDLILAINENKKNVLLDEALDKFRIYKTEVKLQQNDLIKILRTDRDGEYYDPVFFQYVGIIHETTAPYTPQQNGMAERKNKALKEMVNSMLSYSGLESRDAIFDENRFSSIPILKDIIPNVQESQIDDHTDDVPSEIPKPQKAIHNLVIHQMDVKTTFLNGDLDEKVYIKQLEGFVMPGNEHKVCKLVKSLYGLKQAPKQWHQKFDEVVLSSGFHLNQSDKCVYSKFDNFSKRVIISLYVDDMLIFGTDQIEVDETKKFLSSRFSTKDVGEADVILGVKIKRKNKGIVITQSHYIEKILKKFNHEDCSSVSTPVDLREKLKLNTRKPVDHLEYSRAIGCLMYDVISTRPDIAYVVGRLSRFTSNPSRQHWKAITRVFKYLRGTKDYGLSYVGYPSVLEGYSDASWINHVEDSASTSGWVFLLRRGAISWASKKQTCITSSTIEYEFVALAAVDKEAEWLRNLIHEISIWPKQIAPISIR
nr:zinc finger, CCHC-type [Tanacetum cinerariifolium]